MKSKVCLCGATFEMSVRNQKYCQPCRDAKAAALAAELARVRVCKVCGQQSDDVRNHYCVDCRSAKKAAESAEYEAMKKRKLDRINAKGGCPCGKPATFENTGLCDECEDRRRHQVREEWRQARADKPTPPKPQTAPKAVHDGPTIADLAAALIIALAPFLAKEDKPQPKPEVDPDWIDPEEMEAINADCLDILEGLDL